MPFESSKQLIRRARHHTNDFKAQIKSFLDSRPYAMRVDVDRQTKQQVFKVKLTANLPRDLPLVVKDAVSNLRDALDHAVYASAVALGNPSPERTGFPFAQTAAGVTGELNNARRLDQIPPEVRPLLAGFQPYETGNQLLWALNRIRNTKTHRILVPLGMAHMIGNIGISAGLITGGSQIGYSRWDATKNEIEYMRLGPGSSIQHNVNVAVEVLFESVDVVKGKPVPGTLDALIGEVERVVLAIEAETTRIRAARP